MVPVLNVRVIRPAISEIMHVQYVTWDTIPVSLSPAGYRIYRTNDRSEWELLNPDGLYLYTEYRDTTAYKAPIRNTLEYRVTWVDASGTESDADEASVVSFAFPVETTWLQNYVRGNRYRKNWWLEQMGEDVILAKRYQAGTKCSCRNIRTGQQSRSFCDTCLGTGIVGGYRFFSTKLRVRSQTDQVKALVLGLDRPTDVVIWNVNYPPLLGGETGDFFVRRDGLRYAIQDVHGQVVSGLRQYQMGKASMIPPGDPIMRIPISDVEIPEAGVGAYL